MSKPSSSTQQDNADDGSSKLSSIQLKNTVAMLDLVRDVSDEKKLTEWICNRRRHSAINFLAGSGSVPVRRSVLRWLSLIHI